MPAPCGGADDRKLLAWRSCAGWEALVRGGAVDELLLPAPSQVASSLWTTAACSGRTSP